LTPLAAACVFIGGGLGACLRWLVSLLLNPLFHIVPLGTLAVNLIGGYLVGMAAAYFSLRDGLPPEYKLFAITGILGGFTTFSSFSLDAALLVERHSFGLAFGYIVGSIAAGLAALFFGLAVFRSAGHVP